ncbi:hypothetical protein LTR49_024922 [Elasticomyces elasticus]|nr:hypothetical protein LTR49_024922 [Elasticomyces elasticus]
MCLNYAVTHEDFAWAVRSEPGVVGAFEKVFDDADLIVSFHALNFALPNRTDIAPNKPWPHQDQNSLKHGFGGLQGLVNLLPHGPSDGGLIVCKGGHALSDEFHKEFINEPRIPAWTPEWFGFTEAGMKWLKDRGCLGRSSVPTQVIYWYVRMPRIGLH